MEMWKVSISLNLFEKELKIWTIMEVKIIINIIEFQSVWMSLLTELKASLIKNTVWLV